MLIIYTFLITIIIIKNTTVNVKLDFLCNDYCTDISLNDISFKDEVNLNTDTQYYFRTEI